MPQGWFRLPATGFLIVAVLLMVRSHRADAAAPQDGISTGHKLAAQWCAECHAIEPDDARDGKGPGFSRIANLPSTTALSLNVFLRSNHTNMPNFIIAPGDAAEIVQYILSLKRN
ncbi:cytochrome c [Rhodopseudomonas palustris]|uniref:c-type cytochrome n=1 Tax=Rhodopseudomonas palustris TaxID=1076 RepID=UPI0021F2F287|nr:cytochrome c [Rhodopseudomonas palustris]UYO45206.1 cytochrome c [Rhodopseudomonas palustris]